VSWDRLMSVTLGYRDKFVSCRCVCLCVNGGTLIQVTMDKSRSGLGRLSSSFSSSFKDGRKETVRMAFLFTNHLLLTTRASNGRLHLAKVQQTSMVTRPVYARASIPMGQGGHVPPILGLGGHYHECPPQYF